MRLSTLDYSHIKPAHPKNQPPKAEPFIRYSTKPVAQYITLTSKKVIRKILVISAFILTDILLKSTREADAFCSRLRPVLLNQKGMRWLLKPPTKVHIATSSRINEY